MSYILEALKKSQQERELGKVPQLASTAQTKSGDRKPHRLTLPTLLSALLLICILALMLLVRPPAIEKHPSSLTRKPNISNITPTVETPRSDQSQPDAAKQPVISRHSNRKNEAPFTTAKPIEVAQPTKHRATATAVDAQDAAEERSAHRRMREELLEIKNRLESDHRNIEPAKPAPGPQTATGKKVETNKKTDPVAKPTAKSQPTPVKQTPAPAHALPTEVQVRLPQIKISVLAYSTIAERRFITLNGGKAREGEQRPNGLTVEEIRQDGVVFIFEGHRFFHSAYR